MNRVYSFHIGIVDADKKQEKKTSKNNKMNQRRMIFSEGKKIFFRKIKLKSIY
jgi:hypothetical protein